MEKTNICNSIMALQDNLFNFAFMLTANRDEALDLLQDTTLKVLDNQNKFSENTNFKGWAFTIMRNIFINNYRHNSRMTNMWDGGADSFNCCGANQAPCFVAPEGTYAEKEITDVINSLSDDYRIPFSMHVAGYKYDEIAELLTLPLGTVKSRIFFARKQLQRIFADYR